MRAAPVPRGKVRLQPRQAAIQPATQQPTRRLLDRRMGTPSARHQSWLGRYQDWQWDAKRYARTIGVVRFAANLVASTSGRVNLIVEQRNPDGDWEETDDQQLKAYLADYGNETFGQTANELVRLHSWHYQVAGEAVMVHRDDTQGLPEWMVASMDAVEWDKPQKDLATVRFHPGGVVSDGTAVVLPRDQMLRYWMPDEEWLGLATSPMTSVMDDIRRYKSLVRYAQRQAESYLAMNGVLWTPEKAHASQASGDATEHEGDDPTESAEPDDTIFDLYNEWAQMSINDDDSIAAVVPPLVWWGEAGDEPKKIDVAGPLDEHGPAYRQEALQDFARGSDSPMALIAGGGSSDENHWGAWITQERFVAAVAPTLDRVTHQDMTVAFLYPHMRLDGRTDLRRTRIGYDPTPVIVHPDQSDKALRGWLSGLVASESAREAMGFDPSDAPTPADLKLLGEVLSNFAGASGGAPAPGGHAAPGSLPSIKTPGEKVGPATVQEQGPKQPQPIGTGTPLARAAANVLGPYLPTTAAATTTTITIDEGNGNGHDPPFVRAPEPGAPSASRDIVAARRAYTAENFDESLVHREHGRFARQDGGDTLDPGALNEPPAPSQDPLSAEFEAAHGTVGERWGTLNGYRDVIANGNLEMEIPTAGGSSYIVTGLLPVRSLMDPEVSVDLERMAPDAAGNPGRMLNGDPILTGETREETVPVPAETFGPNGSLDPHGLADAITTHLDASEPAPITNEQQYALELALNQPDWQNASFDVPGHDNVSATIIGPDTVDGVIGVNAQVYDANQDISQVVFVPMTADNFSSIGSEQVLNGGQLTLDVMDAARTALGDAPGTYALQDNYNPTQYDQMMRDANDTFQAALPDGFTGDLNQSANAGSFDIRDGQGNTGTINFDISNGALHVDLMELDRGMQDRGVATAMVGAVLSSAEKMGVDRIEFLANISIGGYAWARMGAYPNDQSWATLNSSISGRISHAEDLGVRLSDEQLRNVVDLLDGPPQNITKLAELRDPIDLNPLIDNGAGHPQSAIDRSNIFGPGGYAVKLDENNTLPLGKALLIGTSWSAQIPIGDQAAREEFQQYSAEKEAEKQTGETAPPPPPRITVRAAADGPHGVGTYVNDDGTLDDATFWAEVLNDEMLRPETRTAASRFTRRAYFDESKVKREHGRFTFKEDAQKKLPGVKFVEADPQTFIDARDSMAEKYKPNLTPHGLDEFGPDKIRPFLSEDGLTGFAVAPTGEIMNIFSLPGAPKGAGRDAVLAAIDQGGQWTNNFGGFLERYYADFGFAERDRLTWDDQYAPAGWDFERDDRPDVLEMELPQGTTADDARRTLAEHTGLTGAAGVARPVRGGTAGAVRRSVDDGTRASSRRSVGDAQGSELRLTEERPS